MLNECIVTSHVKFSEHALTACGILGGITFTALVLIMQEEEAFALPFTIGWLSDNYVQILIGGMAGVSAAFILCVIGLVRPAAGLGLYSEAGSEEQSRREAYTNTTIHLFGLGCYGLVGMLPLLVLPFSWLAALVILVLGVLTVGMLTYYGKKPPHH
jgi:hypothetical protein